MKLYYFPVAPNPTRVRLYLAEKSLGSGGRDLGVEPVLVDLSAGEQRSPAHLARNPLGKLPVLELEDGSFLTESTAIVEYLEECYPDPPLIGSRPEERARVRELDRIADTGVLMSVARIVHATRSPLGLPPSPEVAEHAREFLAGPLKLLNARLENAPFVAGDRPSIADCTLQAGLQFGRFGEVEIDPSLEHLARWDRRFRERKSCAEVLSL